MAEFRFRVPFVPASAKNRQRIKRRRTGARFVHMDNDAVAEKAHLQLLIDAAMRDEGCRPGDILFPDSSVAVTVDVAPLEPVVVVRVCELAPRPGRPTGRTRDLHNVFDLIMDAMNERVFTDDRQVGIAHARRWIRGTNC